MLKIKSNDKSQFLLAQTNTDFTKFDIKSSTVPVEISRTGVGSISGHAAVLWTIPMLDKLQSLLESDVPARKVYLGHKTMQSLQDAGELHRDQIKWIATLQGNFKIVETDEIDGLTGKKIFSLIDDMKVHRDNEASIMLANRIETEPDQIFGSLHYFGTIEPKEINGVLVEELKDIQAVSSWDIVPASDFGGLFNPEESQACINNYSQSINEHLKEVKVMNWEEFKEKHPEEAAKAMEEIGQSVINKFKDSDDFKALCQNSDKLKQSNDKLTELKTKIESMQKTNEKNDSELQGVEKLQSDLDKQKEVNKGLEKSLYILQNSQNKKGADNILALKLVDSALPNRVQSKIKENQPDINKHIDASGLLKEKEYSQAIDTELDSWKEFRDEKLQTINHGAGNEINAENDFCEDVHAEDDEVLFKVKE